ncbi:uncharacterized protein METZ01_LOCUS181211 [marine metagenome]|uniref:Uncharacterized protein n=1 Tax=marine metagenome TaxID=408172 RepID=A0A382CSW5_9ZZZZ
MLPVQGIEARNFGGLPNPGPFHRIGSAEARAKCWRRGNSGLDFRPSGGIVP